MSNKNEWYPMLKTLAAGKGVTKLLDEGDYLAYYSDIAEDKVDLETCDAETLVSELDWIVSQHAPEGIFAIHYDLHYPHLEE